MKYNLDRVKVTHTMCVVALYMAQTAVQLSQYALGLEAGTWGLESHPLRGLLLTMWRWPDGAPICSCVARNVF